MAKTKKEEVATVDERGTLPATIQEMIIQDEGAGLEQVESRDLIIPMIKIAEAMAAEVNPSRPEYVEGLKQGQLFNNVTREVFDELTVVPLYRDRVEIEWKANRGGLAGIYTPSEGKLATAVRNQDNKDILPNGNEIVDTGQVYVWVVTGQNTGYQALIPMAKSRLKNYRMWNTTMMSIKEPVGDRVITPAIYGTTYRLKPVSKTNDKGSWYIWDIEYTGPVTDAETYASMRKLSQNIAKGMVKVDYASEDPSAADSDMEQDQAF